MNSVDRCVLENVFKTRMWTISRKGVSVHRSSEGLGALRRRAPKAGTLVPACPPCELRGVGVSTGVSWEDPLPSLGWCTEDGSGGDTGDGGVTVQSLRWFVQIVQGALWTGPEGLVLLTRCPSRPFPKGTTPDFP